MIAVITAMKLSTLAYNHSAGRWKRTGGALALAGALLLGFGAVLSGSGISNAHGVASAANFSAHGIIEKIIERNPSLESYRSRVHVDVRMLNFPFLAPKLDGTSYFKRPNNYEVVFDRVPGYAKGFSRIFNDVGDPSAWERDQNVVWDGSDSVNGHSMLVLRMTKKIHSDILAYTLAYVDPQNFTVDRMEWHYTSGGVISMVQSFRNEGPFTVIASQHIEISIPHVRAIGDASYGAYQTNVAVDEAVFTK
jgi:hypothetical protein